MYWTKINLSIVYAICLIIALFILIGCVKKVEENPSPTTLEKAITNESGEVQVIKTQVYDGKNRYQVGLEITKPNEIVKNKIIKNWTQIGLKINASGVHVSDLTIDNIGHGEFTNQAGARMLKDNGVFTRVKINNTGYDGLGIQGKNCIVQSCTLTNIATEGHTNGDGIMFMPGGTGSVYNTYVELKSFIKHCIKGSADGRATLYDAVGNTCIGGASGIIASQYSVIMDNKISGQQSNPETGIEGRGIVLTNFSGTCSGNVLSNCPIGILVSNSPNLDIEKLRRENTFINCGIDIRVK